MKIRFAAAMLAGALISTVQAQTPSACEQEPEFRQLDFWVGEWEVRNPQGKIVGTSSIRHMIGNCVIFENYTGSRGYEGKSFNVFNSALRKWQQFWVDNRGEVLEFEGEYANGKMVYEGVSKDSAGNDLLHIMTLARVESKNVLQVWNQSADGGMNWKTVFKGLYIPRKKD